VKTHRATWGRTFLVAPTLLLVAGCATVPRDAGFPDVADDVARRTGHRVYWNQGTAEDQSARDGVRALLRGEMTAADAVQVALLNNRGLQATYADLGVAQAQVVQAGLLKNPVFDGDLKFSADGGGTKIELAVVQDFLDVLLIPLRKAVAQTAFEGAKARVTGAVLDLAGRTRAAFYTHQAAGQTLEMRRSVSEATAASYDLARRLRKAGNINDLALAQERAVHEQARLDLAAAEAAVLDTRERLNVLMGLWGADVDWKAAARLPDPPADDTATEGVERRAVENSLDLAVARTEVESGARALGVRRSFGLLPELEVGAAAERELEGGWAVGPAFSLPIPLLDQGQASIAAAGAELARARDRYAATAVEVRSAARAARNRENAARARAAYYKDVMIPLRNQITAQTQLQFNAMQVGAFQLLQAKRDEIEAGVAYIDALRGYWVARAELDQILGGRMTDFGPTAIPSTTGGASSNLTGRGH
jgi:cobalt-zinc-cadmium efflux system outer membrane protein